MENNDVIQNYIQTVNSSRGTLNNILNVMRDQERTLRDAVTSQINNPSNSVNNSTTRSYNSTGINTPPYVVPTSSPNIRPHIPPPGAFSDYQNYNPALNRFSGINNYSSPIDLSIAGSAIHRPPVMPHPTSNAMPSNDIHTTTNSILDRYRSYRNAENSTNNPYRYTPRFFRPPLVNLSDLSPVSIRPTILEIASSTTEFTFGEINNPINSTCPITRETFTLTDRVTRINHCGHIFTTSSFNEWFSRNVRCPVCRHDIRDAIRDNTSNTNVDTSAEDNTTSNASTNMPYDSSDNTTDNVVNNLVEDSSNNILPINQRRNNISQTLDITSNNIETIINYISNDIQNRLNSNDLSNETLIEYGFIIPNDTNEPNGNNNNETNIPSLLDSSGVSVSRSNSQRETDI